MRKKELKEKLGLSDENFQFYMDSGYIRHLGRGKYEYDKKMDHMILEKSTVFKYHFSDDFSGDLRDFISQVKHTGRVKKFSKAEIKALQDKMKKEGKL